VALAIAEKREEAPENQKSFGKQSFGKKCFGKKCFLGVVGVVNFPSRENG